MARRVIGIIREEAENNGMGDLFQAALEIGIFLNDYPLWNTLALC